MLAALGATLATTHIDSHAQGIGADFEVDTWSWVKAQQVLDPRWAYFDTASFAPTTRAVMAAEYRANEQLNNDPVEFWNSRYSGRSMQEFTIRLASRLGCAPDEVALVRSAAAGLARIRQSLKLVPGDEVILAAQLPVEIRQNWQAWAAQTGMVIRVLRCPAPLKDAQSVVDAFTALLSDRTRVAVLSHVQHEDGAVLPVVQLCQLARERSIVTLVEGSLAFGVVPFTATELNCDAYASGLNHWFNAPQHTGLMYVRRERQSQWLEGASPDLPFGIGNDWPTLLRLWPEDLFAHAAAFQAVPAALALHDRITRARIESRLRDLTIYTRLRLQSLPEVEVLTPAVPGMSAAIIALRSTQRAAERISAQLQRVDRVAVHAFAQHEADAQRACVRVSLHIFNNHDEIERLGMGLQRALRA